MAMTKEYKQALLDAADWHTRKSKHHQFMGNTHLKNDTSESLRQHQQKAEFHGNSAYALREIAWGRAKISD